MKKTITMSPKETERITVLNKLTKGRVKQKDAADMLDLSTRQVRRLLKRYQTEGVEGLVHRSRGQPSNPAIPQEEKARIAALIKSHYHDFGPTFAHEKLTANHDVSCSVETVRQVMINHGIWQPRKRTIKKTYPQRERRARVGELSQMDGSPHPWFENRADPCTLLGVVDDATSGLMAGRFVLYEGTFAFFAVTQQYLERHGKPLAFYVDRHSTFKTNRQAAVDEELKDQQPSTQFGRAMAELNIKLIYARSPQAKGRVERLFETLQDRLVKEMRLEGISSPEEGSRYLQEVYLPQHNARFAVPPREAADLHRPLLPHEDLAQIFTRQSTRTVSKDYVVQYQNTRYQLKPPPGYRYTLRKAKITVAEDKNQEVTFHYQGQTIPYTKAVQRKDKKQVASAKSFTEGRVNIPAPDHPWRQSYKTM